LLRGTNPIAIPDVDATDHALVVVRFGATSMTNEISVHVPSSDLLLCNVREPAFGHPHIVDPDYNGAIGAGSPLGIERIDSIDTGLLFERK
jgi:uncharacterized Zn-finger protein